MPTLKLSLALICFGFAAHGGAAELEEPWLQLDPGTHWAPARRVAVSPDDRLVATASDDKTVRLWQIDGHLVHTLRPPIGEGRQGRLYGAAFHPSRPLVAVGGTSATGTSASVYLFDSQTGVLVRTVDAGRGEVKRLTWSADGRWLVAGFATPGAAKVFAVDGGEVSSVMFSGDCYGIDVSPAYRVVATDTSGVVHLYQLSQSGTLERQADVASPASTPIAVSFSEDGKQLALVHFSPERNGVVDILSAADGTWVETLRADSIGRGRTQAVVWGKGGTRLAIGGVRSTSAVNGREAIDAARGFVQEFDLQSRAPSKPKDVASDAITDLQRLADGRIAFTSFDSSWGVLEPANQLVVSVRSTDYVRRSDRLWLLQGDAGVQWQTSGDRDPKHFKFSERVVRSGALSRASSPDLPGLLSGTTDWESPANPKPRILGGSMELAVGEISRAVTRIAQSQDVAWGTGHRLARVAPGGRLVWSFEPGTETRAVQSTQDGRFVVAALSDGTIRWYRARDGVLLLSFYAHQTGQWVLWSPAGYYDASPGAEPLIGWHVNRPTGQASQFFSIGRFRERLYRPDVIDRVLVDAEESTALREANDRRAAALLASNSMGRASTAAAAPGDTRPAFTQAVSERIIPPPKELLRTLPPGLVYKHAPSVIARADKVTLDFGVLLGPEESLTSIVVRRDGILQPDSSVRLPSTFDGKSTGTVTVQIPVGETIVHVVAANAHGFSDALAFTISREGEPVPTEAKSTSVAAAPAPAPAPASAPATAPRPATASAPAPIARNAISKPRLFVLAVGVSRYADRRINQLELPAKDAADFAAVLSAQSGLAYESVETRVLTDQKATRTAILGGLTWLSRSVGEKDFGILFMAGHAVNHPNGFYYFVSNDVSVDQLPVTAVDETSIRSALARLKGRAMLFIDTCHAGNVFGSARGFSRDVSKITNDLASPENGVIVFASSTGRQESLESKEWGNGAFTKAVISGLQGGADFMRRGRVTFQGLGYYVSSEVEKLTKGEQTPVLIAPPPGLPDFTLALLAIERAGYGALDDGLALARFRPEAAGPPQIRVQPSAIHGPRQVSTAVVLSGLQFARDLAVGDRQVVD